MVRDLWDNLIGMLEGKKARVEYFKKQQQKSRNRYTEGEKGLMDTRGRGVVVNWEADTDIYTLLSIKQVTNETLPHSTGGLYSRLRGDLNGSKSKKRGYVCIYS